MAVRRLLPLLIAGMAFFPFALTAQATDTIFVATASSDTIVDLAPIAIFHDGGFDSLPSGGEDSASTHFRQVAYSLGHRLWLYSGGAMIGTAAALDSSMYGCQGLPGSARPQTPLAPGWQGLAVTDSSRQFGAAIQDVTPTELALLEPNAHRLLRDRSIPSSIVDTVSPSLTWAVKVPKLRRSYLAATYRVETPMDSDWTRVTSAFVFLEMGSKRELGRLTWTHDGIEDDAQVRVPVDLLDIDQDGVPEFITVTHYYESWDYQIWRRTPTGWALWLNTGGAGC